MSFFFFFLTLIILTTIKQTNSQQSHAVCSDVYNRPAQSTLQVTYPKISTINKGTVLQKEQTWLEPQLSSPILPNKCYTIIMLDPDAPTSTNPYLGQWLHWFITNRQYSKNKTIIYESIQKGYFGPSPPINSGYHRYCIYLFEQNTCNRIYSSNLIEKLKNQRNNYKINELINENKDILVADNYFIMQTTSKPTLSPTQIPTTKKPTNYPSNIPTNNPTKYTLIPSESIIMDNNNNNINILTQLLETFQPSNVLLIMVTVAGCVCFCCGLLLCLAIRNLKKQSTKGNNINKIKNGHYAENKKISINLDSLPFKNIKKKSIKNDDKNEENNNFIKIKSNNDIYLSSEKEGNRILNNNIEIDANLNINQQTINSSSIPSIDNGRASSILLWMWIAFIHYYTNYT